MTRPIIDGWFDSTIEIWRGTPSQDARATETIRYTLVAAEVGAVINRSRTPVSAAAAGLAPTGQLRLYLRFDQDIRVRDVVRVSTGPDSETILPRTWEVNELPVRPRGHHTQIDAIEWHGTLEDLSS